MPDPIETLRGLADLPADAGPPAAEIRARGRRRVRRRRAVLGSAAAVLLLAGAAVAAGRADDDGRPVRTGPGPTPSLPAEPAPSATIEGASTTATGTAATDPMDQGLRVVPNRDLADEVAAVTVSLLGDATDPDAADPDTTTWIGQCAFEAIDLAYLDERPEADVRSWCRGIVDDPIRPFGLSLDRRISTPIGTVDCAASVGRCLAVARVGPDDLRWATLGFTGDPEGGPGLALAVDPAEPVPDGGGLTVTGTGGVPGTAYTLQQCATTGPAATGDEGADCDIVRTKEVYVGDDGTFTTPFLVTANLTVPTEAGTDDPFSVGCEGCVLRATSILDHTDGAEVALRIIPSRTNRQTWITAEETGPLVPGGTITLRGQAFQVGGRTPQLGWCAAVVEAGVPDDCTYPEVAPPTITDVGDFTWEFPLPPADHTTPGGVRCAGSATACFLAEVPGEGAAPLYRVPLDLTG